MRWRCKNNVKNDIVVNLLNYSRVSSVDTRRWCDVDSTSMTTLDGAHPAMSSRFTHNHVDIAHVFGW